MESGNESRFLVNPDPGSRLGYYVEKIETVEENSNFLNKCWSSIS